MGGPYARPGSHSKKRLLSTKYRLRRRAKDLDQIVEDLEAGRRQVEVDEDLPGGGQFQCVECSRFFISPPVLEAHLRSKSHKKRVKELKDKPYTLEEAQAAGGAGSNDFYLRNPQVLRPSAATLLQ